MCVNVSSCVNCILAHSDTEAVASGQICFFLSLLYNLWETSGKIAMCMHRYRQGLLVCPRSSYWPQKTEPKLKATESAELVIAWVHFFHSSFPSFTFFWGLSSMLCLRSLIATKIFPLQGDTHSITHAKCKNIQVSRNVIDIMLLLQLLPLLQNAGVSRALLRLQPSHKGSIVRREEHHAMT